MTDNKQKIIDLVLSSVYTGDFGETALDIELLADKIEALYKREYKKCQQMKKETK